ncbi:heavy metal translocating P-type ATPase [Deefgea piscis]
MSQYRQHSSAHAAHSSVSHAACCAGHSEGAALTTLAAAELTADGWAQTPIRIMQMDCPTEEALLRKKLGAMTAVSGLEFNLMQRVLTVQHQPEALEAILAAIRSLGFTPELGEAVATDAPVKPWWPLALAGVAALAAEVTHWLDGPTLLVAGLALLAVLACGLTTYKKGWIALSNGNLNINALMSIAVTGAMLIGQWPEAAMVMVLFTVAELIEAKSLDRARNAIQGLLRLAPDKATVQQDDGSWLDVPAQSLLIGQRVRVKPGEQIAVDGQICAGQSTINQAPITGESLAVDKGVGDPVFAGSINEAGSFEFTVTALASNSTLARIIHAVEAAQGTRAPIQRFIDQFARVYTPIVFAIALLVAILPPLFFAGDWLAWVYKALVLLVIACPCALVISTPVTIVSGLAAAARHGILIKGGVYLEEGRKLACIALDKTGTLTHGKPVQTDFIDLQTPAQQTASAAQGIAVEQLAVSLAQRSDHPVSRALALAGQDVALLEVSGFTALLGLGVEGTIAGQRYYLGNHRLIHQQGWCSAELEAQLLPLEAQGKSVILLASEQGVLALFAVADTVKDSSRQAIAELHALGVKTMMLTGDNAHTARSIAEQVGIDEARGDLLPTDKLELIVAQQAQLTSSQKIGMVGDGINDAPALARADIGFAMGAAGSGTAIETADVALMDDDLRKLPRFIRLSQLTHRILLQNIALALGIKLLFLILTLLGYGSMWMAVFADVGASLLVVANGLRLLRTDALFKRE